jgi:CopG family transcriptional regulator / antitoxin EndoAI
LRSPRYVYILPLENQQPEITPMNKRTNIILPATTVSVLDRVAVKGRRSALIDQAIRRYVDTQGQQNLRERLKQEALVNAARDLRMAAEWFPLEEEARQAAQARKRKK